MTATSTRTRIAVAQLVFADATNADERAAVTVEAIEKASADGADLVILPELAATGYVLTREHVAEHAQACDLGDGVLGAWATAATAHDIAVVGGYAERAAGRWYNAAVAIDAHGRVAGRYRKLHLFGDEHGLFAPGDHGLPVVELAGLRVGIAICYDLRFPETVRILALQGAHVVGVPTAWVGGFDPRPPDPDRQIGQVEAAIVHANLNQVVIACADFAGSTPQHRFLGRSLVVGPYGDVLAGPLPHDAAAAASVDVDRAAVIGARERGPGISPRANRRTDVYGELLGYDPSTTIGT